MGDDLSAPGPLTHPGNGCRAPANGAASQAARRAGLCHGRSPTCGFWMVESSAVVVMWKTATLPVLVGALAGCGGRVIGADPYPNADGGRDGSSSGGYGGSSGGQDAGAAGGHAATPRRGPEGPSCSAMLGFECQGESCCSSIALPVQSLLRGRSTETCSNCVEGCPQYSSTYACSTAELPELMVSVRAFALDKYEVTVGRFRRFVDAGFGTQTHPPAEGAGAHPLYLRGGWSSAWNASLPSDSRSLDADLRCSDTLETWAVSDTNDTVPINCVSWYLAFAFCVWDGGRLPSEMEWEVAAAGGSENRLHPWGSDVMEPLPANYIGNRNTPLLAVGSEPLGSGRWGHADLAGSMWEWVANGWCSDYSLHNIRDCDNWMPPDAGHGCMRGGYWNDGPNGLRAAARNPMEPEARSAYGGFRCARSPE